MDRKKDSVTESILTSLEFDEERSSGKEVCVEIFKPTNTEHASGGSKENNLEGKTQRLGSTYHVLAEVDGKSDPILSHSDNLLNARKANVESVMEIFEPANDHGDVFVEVDKNSTPSCSQSGSTNTDKKDEMKNIRQIVGVSELHGETTDFTGLAETSVLESGKVDCNASSTMHQAERPEDISRRIESAENTSKSQQELEQSSNDEAMEDDNSLFSINAMGMKRDSRKVVYLQHGILDSSMGWVANGVVGSPAFAAFDQGYDVFLGNFHGLVSREHINTKISSQQYWKYSINEHGTRDIPAMVEKIHEIKISELKPRKPDPKEESSTDQPYKLCAICHSLGGAVGDRLSKDEQVLSVAQALMSSCWYDFFTLQEVELHMSTACHPQLDGQTEIVSRCWRTCLRYMCGYKSASLGNSMADCSKLLHRRLFFKLLEVVLEFGNRMNGETESAPHKIEEPKHRTERIFRVFKGMLQFL